jgi:hypothetical protein
MILYTPGRRRRRERPPSQIDLIPRQRPLLWLRFRRGSCCRYAICRSGRKHGFGYCRAEADSRPDWSTPGLNQRIAAALGDGKPLLNRLDRTRPVAALGAAECAHCSAGTVLSSLVSDGQPGQHTLSASVSCGGMKKPRISAGRRPRSPTALPPNSSAASEKSNPGAGVSVPAIDTRSRNHETASVWGYRHRDHDRNTGNGANDNTHRQYHELAGSRRRDERTDFIS